MSKRACIAFTCLLVEMINNEVSLPYSYLKDFEQSIRILRRKIDPMLLNCDFAPSMFGFVKGYALNHNENGC